MFKKWRDPVGFGKNRENIRFLMSSVQFPTLF